MLQVLKSKDHEVGSRRPSRDPYLSERKQCVKVGVDFSAWKNIY
jgi:hypothetical protein